MQKTTNPKEPKYQLLIKKIEDAGIKNLNDATAFTEDSNNMMMFMITLMIIIKKKREKSFDCF